MNRRPKGCPNCDGTGRASCPLCDGTNVPFPEEHKKELTDQEKWPIEEWQEDVRLGDTKLGYLDWVQHQLPLGAFDKEGK
jgi:hypothetical protein